MDDEWLLVILLIGGLSTYILVDSAIDYFRLRYLDQRIERAEQRLDELNSKLDNEPKIVFSQDQMDALIALLTLVHYDDLAMSYRNMLPSEILDELNKYSIRSSHE